MLALSPPAWLSRRLGPVSGNSVRVSVLDSGWDTNVRDPGMCIGHGINLLDGTDQPLDVVGHGTACITTIHRYAPGTTLCPVKVFDDGLKSSVAMVCTAIDWSIDHSIDIIHLSLCSVDPASAEILYNACDKAASHGILIVAAAAPSLGACYPAVFDNVLSVGYRSELPPFDYEYVSGAEVECWASAGVAGEVVGLAGKIVMSTASSYAAPQITGIAALYREHERRIGRRGNLRHFLRANSLSSRRELQYGLGV